MKLRMVSSESSMKRTPFGRKVSTWPSSGVRDVEAEEAIEADRLGHVGGDDPDRIQLGHQPHSSASREAA